MTERGIGDATRCKVCSAPFRHSTMLHVLTLGEQQVTQGSKRLVRFRQIQRICSVAYRSMIVVAIVVAAIGVFLVQSRNPLLAGILLVLGTIAALSFAVMSLMEAAVTAGKRHRSVLGIVWNSVFVLGSMAIGFVALWHAMRAVGVIGMQLGFPCRAGAPFHLV